MSLGLFHHTTNVVSRLSETMPSGRSVVAAAAYRSGEPLADERHERVWSYRKPEVLHEEVLLPVGAPAWAANRELLWNAVERSEKRKDAQLAREVEFAIPLEVPKSGWSAWCRRHLQAYVDAGMTCDVSIHDKPGNPHCHALLTMREWDGDKLATKKNRAWNDQSLVDHHRARYERQINDWMEQHGHETRVSRQSYAEQGIDQEPQIHVGAVAHAIHQKHLADPVAHPDESVRWLVNETIQGRQSERQVLKTAIAAIQEQIHAALNAPPIRLSRRPPISGPLSPRAAALVSDDAGRAASSRLHPGGARGRAKGRSAFDGRDPAGAPLRDHGRRLGQDRRGHEVRDLVPVLVGGRGVSVGFHPVGEAALPALGAPGTVLPPGGAPQRNHGPARGVARQTPTGRPAVVGGGSERPGQPGRPGAAAHLPQRPAGAGAAARLALGPPNLADLHPRPGGTTAADPGADRGGHGAAGGRGALADQAGRGPLEHQRRGPGDLSRGDQASTPLDGSGDAPLRDGLVGVDADADVMELLDIIKQKQAAQASPKKAQLVEPARPVPPVPAPNPAEAVKAEVVKGLKK